MKALLAALALVGCGGHPAIRTAPFPSAAGATYSALRFVPAKPTYIVAAQTLRDGQRSLGEAIDPVAELAGVDRAELSRALVNVIDVDPLSPDAIAALGLDLDGGFAMFSDGLSPTFVAHVAVPEQLQSFFDRERDRGLVTQSVIVDRNEVFTATLPVGFRISWVVADGWLWVHLALPLGHDEGTSWFAASHKPLGADWLSGWRWAEAAASKTATTIGYVDLRALMATVSSVSLLSAGVPARDCARIFEPAGKLGLAIDGDLHHASARVTVDVGAAGATIRSAILPPPDGWNAAAAAAPLAIQWNLDLIAARTWIEPCARAIGSDLAMLDSIGLRSARALLLTFDPSELKGTGAVAVDLGSRAYFARRLDDIPFRTHLESDRTFGRFAGHTLSIPTVATVDYVLTDKLGLAAIGDGLLAKLVVGTPTPSPVLAIDIVPAGLPPDSWAWLLDAASFPHAKRVATWLMRLHDAHLSVTVDHTDLVLELSGKRR